MRRERTDHPLDATALTNEVLLRLLKRERDGEDPSQLVREGLLEMRSILVDYGRKRQRQGRVEPFDGDQEIRIADAKAGFEDAVHIEMLLEDLEKVDPRAAEIVQLRFFLGLSTEESAEFLSISVRMVHRHWAFARDWLKVHWVK
jgi:RNA polymerase sigma factor (TIGR02999 family)